MLFCENPFLVLDVTPQDSLDVVDQKASDKTFMDEENESKYEDARFILSSPVKRIAAETSWIVDADLREKAKTRQLVDIRLLNGRDPLDRINICIEQISRLDINRVSDIIMAMDNDYNAVINADYIRSAFNNINSARKYAEINEIGDVGLVENAIKDKLKDIDRSVKELIDRNGDEQIIEVVNFIAAETIEAGKNYGQVIEHMIDAYAIRVAAKLDELKIKILGEIEQIKVDFSEELLEEICGTVRYFDHVAQPIQLLLQKQGSSNSQAESVVVANSLRELAAHFYTKQNRDELALKIIELEMELFSELPAIYHELQDDKNILVALRYRKAQFSSIGTKIDECWKHIKLDVKRAKENQRYLMGKAPNLLAELNEKAERLVQYKDSSSEEYMGICMNLAFYYKRMADLLGWGALFKDSESCYLESKKYAEKCNDDRLILEVDKQLKDVRGIIKEFGDKIPVLPASGSNINNTSQEIGNASNIKKVCVLIGIILAIVIGFFFSKNENGNSTVKSNPQINSVNRVTQHSLIYDIEKIGKVETSIGNFIGNNKVLVWDKKTGKQFSTLPQTEGVLWKKGDDKGYVVVIENYNEVRVATYSLNGSGGAKIPGYRKDAKVYVYDMRTNKCLGTDIIKGDNPPKSYRSKYTPTAIYGEVEKPVSDWIIKHFDLNNKSVPLVNTPKEKSITASESLEKALKYESREFKKVVRSKAETYGTMYHVVYDGAKDAPIYKFAYIADNGKVRVIIAAVPGNKMKVLSSYYVSNDIRTDDNIVPGTVWDINSGTLATRLWKAVYAGTPTK